jgi:hypothetical protein
MDHGTLIGYLVSLRSLASTRVSSRHHTLRRLKAAPSTVGVHNVIKGMEQDIARAESEIGMLDEIMTIVERSKP